MKHAFTIIILVLFCVVAQAQADSVYKYTYQFSPPVVTVKPLITTINPSAISEVSTSIRGQGKDDTAGHIRFPIKRLRLESKKGEQVLAGGVGNIDTLIDPGSYHLSVNMAGYKPFDTSFSVGNKTTLHFTVILEPFPFIAIYDISSKKELTPKDIDKIKACVFKKGNWWKCSKKGSYYIDIQI